MQLLDFKITEKQSFARGFMKGLGAPVALFGTFHAPVMPEIIQIKCESIDAGAAISRDWQKIGNDFNIAINKYGETKQK